MDNSSLNVAKPIGVGSAGPIVCHENGMSSSIAEDMGTGTSEEMVVCTPDLPECLVFDMNVEGPGPGSLTMKGSAGSPGGETVAVSEAGKGSMPCALSFSLSMDEMAESEV